MLEFGTAWLVWMTEVPLYYLLMSGVAQKKCPAWLNLAIGFGLATIMTVGNILNHNNGIINITTTFLPSFSMVSCVTRFPFPVRLFSAVSLT